MHKSVISFDFLMHSWLGFLSDVPQPIGSHEPCDLHCMILHSAGVNRTHTWCEDGTKSPPSSMSPQGESHCWLTRGCGVEGQGLWDWRVTLNWLSKWTFCSSGIRLGPALGLYPLSAYKNQIYTTFLLHINAMSQIICLKNIYRVIPLS